MKPTKAQRVALRMAIQYGGLIADCTLDPRTERALVRNGWIRRLDEGEKHGRRRRYPDYVITPTGRAALCSLSSNIRQH